MSSPGANGREDVSATHAIGAGYAPAELDVLSDNWNVGETISSETVRDLI